MTSSMTSSCHTVTQLTCFLTTDVDIGKKMNSKDKAVSRFWEKFRSKNCVIDPFRIQYPKKKTFSFVAPTGKSRGDRVYINEDYMNSLSSIKYINTPFNSAHKIMTFDIQSARDIGPTSWKLNSSILDDDLYIKEVEDVYQGITDLSIDDPIKKWHLFQLVIEGITIQYTQRKAIVKKA